MEVREAVFPHLPPTTYQLLPTAPRLEAEMYSELHLPHATRGIGDLTGTRHIDGAVRLTPVVDIEGVEILPTEFKRFAFGNDERLGQREIEIIERRSPQRVGGCRTVPIWLLRITEGGGVKPHAGGLIRDMRIANFVRPDAIEVGIDRS